MGNKITVIYFDVAGKKAPVKMEIRDEIDEYYRLINCDTIDIISRKINDVPVCVVLDDEGYFKRDIKISGRDKAESEFLVGNLIITGRADKEGDLTSLSPADITKIAEGIERIYCYPNKFEYCIIFD